MATMNVSLPVEMVDFVENEVSEGGYASSSEVVRDALRLLQHDKALEREKLAILRREISGGDRIPCEYDNFVLTGKNIDLAPMSDG